MDRCTRVMHYFSWSTVDKWWWICRENYSRDISSYRQGVFFLYQNLPKFDSEKPVLQWNFVSWLLTSKSLQFLPRMELFWCRQWSGFSVILPCSGAREVWRLNQYLQQLQRNFTFKPSEFSWLLNLSEIILLHLLAGFRRSNPSYLSKGDSGFAWCHFKKGAKDFWEAETHLHSIISVKCSEQQIFSCS